MRMPVHFDEKLNKEVLCIIAKAPLFLLSFGFWMITNFDILPYKGMNPREIIIYSKETMIFSKA
jgi:hypothetical protein